MFAPQLRPLGVGELIDVALKIWRRHFGTLARIVVVIVAPIQILANLILASVTPDEAFLETDFETEPFGPTTDPTFGDFGPVAPEFDGGDVAGFLAGGITALLLPLLASLLASAALLRAVSVAYLGGRPDWKESLQLAARRMGSLIWLAVLMGVGLIVAFLFLFVPGVWLAVSWSVAFAVLVAEDRGGTQALRRSFGLVRSRWWPTLGALLLGFVLQWIVGFIVGLPLGIIAAISEPGSLTAFLASGVASIVASVVTTPFLAAVFVLVYFDLRVRKEGFDLELLAQSIGSPDLPASEGPGGGWPPPPSPPSRPWPPPGPAS